MLPCEHLYCGEVLHLSHANQMYFALLTTAPPVRSWCVQDQLGHLTSSINLSFVPTESAVSVMLRAYTCRVCGEGTANAMTFTRSVTHGRIALWVCVDLIVTLLFGGWVLFLVSIWDAGAPGAGRQQVQKSIYVHIRTSFRFFGSCRPRFLLCNIFPQPLCAAN